MSYLQAKEVKWPLKPIPLTAYENKQSKCLLKQISTWGNHTEAPGALLIRIYKCNIFVQACVWYKIRISLQYNFSPNNFWLFQDKLSFTAVNFIRSENNLTLLHLFIDARNLWAHALNSEHAQSAWYLFVDAHLLQLVGYAYDCVCVHTLGDLLF